MLPDFSEAANEATTVNIDVDELAAQTRTEAPEAAIVDDQKLLDVILALVRRERDNRAAHIDDTTPPTRSHFMPTVRLLFRNSHSARVSENAEARLLMHHCVELNSLIDSLAIDSSAQQSTVAETLDVYRENDAAQILDCIGNIEQLRRAVEAHQETHPENVVLVDILELVNAFMRLACNTPQMKFASFLERLLGKKDFFY